MAITEDPLPSHKEHCFYFIESSGIQDTLCAKMFLSIWIPPLLLLWLADQFYCSKWRFFSPHRYKLFGTTDIARGFRFYNKIKPDSLFYCSGLIFLTLLLLFWFCCRFHTILSFPLFCMPEPLHSMSFSLAFGSFYWLSCFSIQLRSFYFS